MKIFGQRDYLYTMPTAYNYFTHLEALQKHIRKKQPCFMVINYRNCDGYAGMVLAILITVDHEKERYELTLEWMSLGLDLYGDTLQESYIYAFDNLEGLLAYLRMKYAIAITDIPDPFQFDPRQFPNPINNAGEKPLFEKAWQGFQEDFEKGMFLDASLRLVASSLDR